ncbi:F0F1 ATP synthase subunit B [Blattabacterium cuenoti]|uniref:F0F1 ATP synthase subunit B n=1 Tax=Blattabacterium cuenoti TaxID=1653831 RepID=UPI00163B70F9|nr:F0F1 ATP synthase subunit B [Blattabacterium cuenoti]
MDLVSPSIGLIFWHTIIFLTLIFVLSKFAWKPIINVIEHREKIIRISLENSEKLQKEIKNMENKRNHILKEAYIKRDCILRKTLQITNEMKRNAEKEGILKKMEIINNAKQTMKNEKKIYMHKLQYQIGNISIMIAEKILEKKLNNENDQKKLIKNLMEKINSSYIRL